MKTRKQLAVLAQLKAGVYRLDLSGKQPVVLGPSGRPLKFYWHNGYARVSLSDPDWRSSETRRRSLNIGLHNLVVLAGRGEPYPDDWVVDHLDNDPSNNRPENLRACPSLENNRASRRKSVVSSVTPEQKAAVHRVLEMFPNVHPSVLAQILKIHPDAI